MPAPGVRAAGDPDLRDRLARGDASFLAGGLFLAIAGALDIPREYRPGGGPPAR